MNRHPSQATLRRILDEPDAVPMGDRQHAASCRRCGQASQAMAAAAAMAVASLAASGPDPEALPALRRLRQSEPAVVPARPGMLERLRDAAMFDVARRRVLRLGAVGTTVALLLGTLVATGAAGNLIKIFEPDNFVAVPIDITSLLSEGQGSLPDLGGFGSIHVLQQPSVTMTNSAAAAATASGLHLLVTGSLPGSVKGQPRYLAVGPGSASFTFDAQAASGTASRLGKPMPAIPAGLDGAVLTLDGGPLVVETVGSQPGLGGLLPAEAGDGVGASPDPKLGPGHGPGHGLGLLGSLGGIPQLVIVQMKAPVLYSDHLSVTQYEDALLSMPGVPPALAAQIRSLGDLSSTLPIPIPTNLASSHAADINGAPGLVIGDTTGIASAVIWQRNGQVYAVVGSLTDAQVVAIARGMR